MDHIKKEIMEIITALHNNTSFDLIIDSYEGIYNTEILDYLKTKDEDWIFLFFNHIESVVDKFKNNDNARELVKNNIYFKNLNKSLLDYIIDSVYEVTDMIRFYDIRDDIDIDGYNDVDMADCNFVDVPLTEAIANIKWRNNQLNAINNIMMQNFASGVIAQIMGSGKTFIEFHSIHKHFEKYKENKIYIITCSRQEVLRDLLHDADGNLDYNKVKKLKDNNIIDLDKFKIRTRIFKDQKIKKKINTSSKKPTLLIVNTDFLRVIDKNKLIDYNDVALVLFDECHGVSAPKFYNILENIKYNHKVPIIGFSATPLRQGKVAKEQLCSIFSKTFDIAEQNKKLNIISNYDFMQAISDGIILAPYFVICEAKPTLNHKIGRENKQILKNTIDKVFTTKIVSSIDTEGESYLAPYHKILGWCRTIHNAYPLVDYYKFFKTEYKNELTLYCSSYQDEALKSKYKFNTNVDKYKKDEENSVMLCVNRFREGSDIYHCDIGILLDFVKKRGLLSFLQIIGRILRNDPEGRKKFGIIIDAFINTENDQVEIITAQHIIGYYKQLLSLCDDYEYGDMMDAYDKMMNLCDNIKFDEQEQEIKYIVDDKTMSTFKLQLLTKKFDFSKLKLILTKEINTMFKIDKDNNDHEAFVQFKQKVVNSNIKNMYEYDAKWQELHFYVLKEDGNKEKIEPKERFSSYFKNWYEFLDIDTSKFIKNKDDWIKKCIELGLTKDNYLNKVYKYDYLPDMPQEFYINFTSLSNELKSKVKRNTLL